jgi:hypothetical protein
MMKCIKVVFASAMLSAAASESLLSVAQVNLPSEMSAVKVGGSELENAISTWSRVDGPRQSSVVARGNDRKCKPKDRHGSSVCTS